MRWRTLVTLHASQRCSVLVQNSVTKLRHCHAAVTRTELGICVCVLTTFWSSILLPSDIAKNLHVAPYCRIFSSSIGVLLKKPNNYGFTLDNVPPQTGMHAISSDNTHVEELADRLGANVCQRPSVENFLFSLCCGLFIVADPVLAAHAGIILWHHRSTALDPELFFCNHISE